MWRYVPAAWLPPLVSLSPPLEFVPSRRPVSFLFVWSSSSSASLPSCRRHPPPLLLPSHHITSHCLALIVPPSTPRALLLLFRCHRFRCLFTPSCCLSGICRAAPASVRPHLPPVVSTSIYSSTRALPEPVPGCQRHLQKRSLCASIDSIPPPSSIQHRSPHFHTAQLADPSGARHTFPYKQTARRTYHSEPGAPHIWHILLHNKAY